MTPKQRADEILGQYEQTTMGWLVGGEDADPNHVRGVTVGRMRRQIADAIGAAVAAETARSVAAVERVRDYYIEWAKNHPHGTAGEYAPILNEAIEEIKETAPCVA